MRVREKGCVLVVLFKPCTVRMVAYHWQGLTVNALTLHCSQGHKEAPGGRVLHLTTNGKLADPQACR
jgi:hypothetical protein